MDHKRCLNCGNAINSRFCPECGQKADTHRVTVSHFIQHDLIHGLWHLDKGILFTFKEAVKRPGRAALDYIHGKRIRYYNIFYLAILLMGLHLMLNYFYRTVNEVHDQSQNDPVISEFLSKYYKLIVLSIVPFMALNAALLFRRARLNIAEHMIIAGFTLTGILSMSLFVTFFNFMANYFDSAVFGFLTLIFAIGTLLFPVWAYTNAFSREYSALVMSLRVIVFFLLVVLQILLAASLLVVFGTETGELYFES